MLCYLFNVTIQCNNLTATQQITNFSVADENALKVKIIKECVTYDWLLSLCVIFTISAQGIFVTKYWVIGRTL